MSSFEASEGGVVCASGHAGYLCSNGSVYQVCNRYHALPDALCGSCRLNRTVPDLLIAGHRDRWSRLEAAKRRMLYELDLVGLHADFEDGALPLCFDFITNALPQGEGRWIDLIGGERIYTGHADGVITINVREADSIEREKSRVALGESQRTLVGHFRHEVGHYVWDLLIKDDPVRLDRFKQDFGDPYEPSYSAAMKQHYEQGAPADWRSRYISAYSSMHPWEDWAETWHAYLELRGTLEMLVSVGWLGPEVIQKSLELQIDAYVEVGVVINEINRNAGLLPLVPEWFIEPVRSKLAHIHGCIQASISRPLTA